MVAQPQTAHDNADRAMVVKLERKRLRATLVRDEDGREDFFAFQARCIEKFGLAAGVYVRQLVFWDGKGQDPEGWIYKTEDEMRAETGLGRRSQRDARKTLTALSVLEELRKGLPRRLFYRVDLEALAAVLEVGGSNLNQWKVGMRKDPETGKFYRPEEATLNQSYRQDANTDLAREDGISVLASGDGISDPTSEDGISDPTSEDGISDPTSEDDTSDLAITESTYRDKPRRVTAEGTSKSSFRESSFQEAGNAQNRVLPPPTNNKFFKDPGHKPQAAAQARQTSFGDQADVNEKLISEVRHLMEHGRHAPLALRHYREGNVEAEEVAEFVSQDARGTTKAAPALLRAVRCVLDEVVEVEA